MSWKYIVKVETWHLGFEIIIESQPNKNEIEDGVAVDDAENINSNHLDQLNK